MRTTSSRLLQVLALVGAGLAAPACGEGPGDNNGNNSTVQDGGSDVDVLNTFDAGDAGDASPMADAGLPPANCIQTGRTGIADSYLPLIDPITGNDCDPVRLLRSLQDMTLPQKFQAMCGWPNNGILTMTTDGSPILTEAARLPQSAEVPAGGSQGDIMPRNLVFFSPDGSTQLAVAPFNMEDAGDTVLSGAFLLDANGAPLIETQRFDFDTLVAGGYVLSYYGAKGAAFSNGMVWFALENCDSAGQCITSDVMGVPIEERVNGDWIMGDGITTWWTGLLGANGTESHRPTAVSSVNDDVVVATFAGVASSDASDWKRPQIAFYDTSAPIMLDEALRSFDNLGLDNNWQLVDLPIVPMTSDKKSFVTAAENPYSGENKVVVLNVDDNANIASTNARVEHFDLPAELPNPAFREGSDDPATVAVGGVTNIVVDGNRAYVTTAGDGVNYGFLFAVDIDPATGAMTPVGSVGVGIGPTVAGFDPDTGKLYQVVRTPNCAEEDDEARYVAEIDVDVVAFDPLP